MLARHVNLLLAAAENVAGNWPGYALAAASLLVGLALMLAGVAIGEGLRAEAVASVEAGADVYCTWDAFGRDAPVPVDRVGALAAIPGVERAVPRIIGRVVVGDEVAVVVGVPLDALAAPPAPIPLDGALPRGPGDVLVGHELARALGLRPGATIALDAHDLRLFTVSGVVSSTSSLWSAKTIVCALPEAAIVFGETGSVSDVCLFTRPGYADRVATAAERLDRRFRVQTKSLVRGYVHRGLALREGIFAVLVSITLVLAIPAFTVMTFLGHTPRRREIGLLKAEGWRTSDVLEMVALENVIVSLAAAAGASLLAVAWVRGLRAPLVASFMIAELPRFPRMAIPCRFLPLPPVLALMFSLLVTMSGSIYTTWRTAITRPVEVLR